MHGRVVSTFQAESGRILNKGANYSQFNVKRGKKAITGTQTYPYSLSPRICKMDLCAQSRKQRAGVGGWGGEARKLQ